MKPAGRTIRIWIIVSVAVLAAYACRLIGNAGIHSKTVGIIRSGIYITLFILWGIYVKNHILQVQVRRYLYAVVVLVVFWFLVRTAKFNFISETLYPDAIRYCWYLYYLPMIFIPLLGVFVAMSLGKPENYHLPKQTSLFYIPAGILFGLIITNDFHQLVFTFPENATVWNDKNNGYMVLYYITIGWMIICAVNMFITLYKKSRVPDTYKHIILPCIPSFFLLIYMVLYYSGFKWVRLALGDVTAVTCVMYVITFEICIRCGFIQANTHYPELFDASTVGAQITDEEYNVFLSSRTAKAVPQEILCKTENGPVMIDDGVRILEAPIRGGHVIWSEDLSSLLSVLNELNETKENLEDENALLEEENRLKAREAHIAEQERLYNIIQRDTAGQIDFMDELIGNFESAVSEEERIKILHKMLVVGAYLKRRSNLVFLSDKASMLPAKEIELTFGESLDNLEIYGVVCGFKSEIYQNVPSELIIKAYDLFEKIVERSFDRMSCITVYAGVDEERFFIIINTDSGSDFSDIISDTVAAVKDEDGEWKITMLYGSGGDGK